MDGGGQRVACHLVRTQLPPFPPPQSSCTPPDEQHDRSRCRCSALRPYVARIPRRCRPSGWETVSCRSPLLLRLPAVGSSVPAEEAAVRLPVVPHFVRVIPRELRRQTGRRRRRHRQGLPPSVSAGRRCVAKCGCE